MLRQLLFTDFDGLPAEPDDVIADALDGGYAERTEGLVALLRDENADPAARFLACCVLCSWADPIGYATVVEAAGAPGDLAWRGQTYDRFSSQDDTFAHRPRRWAAAGTWSTSGGPRSNASRRLGR
ncbi:hypothetical protein ACF1B0_14135 [Streptomyces anandii]|uniref:hypothetical protein n=1 Tax=Streptomyces anandii TaxID=285454 RepID=UPI0036F9F7D9